MSNRLAARRRPARSSQDHGVRADAYEKASPRDAGIDWLVVAGLLLPLVLLAVLSLRQLGALSFWRDEVSSVLFARGSVEDLLTIVGRDRDAVGLANMAAYYLVLHFWMVLGDTEEVIRLLSVAFGVAGVVPVYFVARRVGGRLAAVVAAVTFAMMPFVIHYSQEARGYSLAMLVSGALTWLLLIGVDRRERVWPWLAYGVVGALGLYVHFFVALVILAHGIWILATRSFPPWRSALAAGLPLALAVAPVPWVIAQYGGGHGWIRGVTPDLLLDVAVGLAGGPILLLVVTLAIGAALYLRRGDSRIWLLALVLFVPIAGAAVVSVIKPVLVLRYFAVCVPAIATLIGVGVTAMPGNLWRIGSAIVLAGALVLALPRAYGDGRGMDWGAAAAWIAAEGTSADALVIPQGRELIDYYLDRYGMTEQPVAATAKRARQGGFSRVWVVLEDWPPVIAKLRGYDVVHSRPFGRRLHVALLERR
jgi:mannosyltransferase